MELNFACSKKRADAEGGEKEKGRANNAENKYSGRKAIEQLMHFPYFARLKLRPLSAAPVLSISIEGSCLERIENEKVGSKNRARRATVKSRRSRRTYVYRGYQAKGGGGKE